MFLLCMVFNRLRSNMHSFIYRWIYLICVGARSTRARKWMLMQYPGSGIRLDQAFTTFYLFRLEIVSATILITRRSRTGINFMRLLYPLAHDVFVPLRSMYILVGSSSWRIENYFEQFSSAFVHSNLYKHTLNTHWNRPSPLETRNRRYYIKIL